MAIKRLIALLAPPVFPGEEERTNKAAFLNAILYSVILLGGAGAAAILLAGGGGIDTILFTGTTILVAFFCLWLMRRGSIRTASLIILIVLWGLFTVIVALAGGVQIATFGCFGVLSLIGGFLLGYRGIIASVAAAVLTGLGLYLAEMAGLLPPLQIDSLTAWIVYSVIFIFQGLLLYYGLRALDIIINRWRNELWERRRMEDALRISEDRFRRVIEALPIGIYLFDLNEDNRLVLRMSNPASTQGFQKDQHPFMGTSVEEILAGLGESEMLEHFYSVVHGGEPFTKERSLVESGKVTLAVEERLFSAGPRSMAAAFVDITRFKQSEQERESLIRELEAKNAELERFTYTVSHDLKSPLITIRGFLGFIARDAQSGNIERLNADLNRVSEATTKMQQLLDDLLELSRIGRIINTPQTVSFNTIVRDALELVAGQIAARGVQVTVQPDMPAISGDRARLVEVMQNLLDNAVKFMGSQLRPHIEVGSRLCDQPEMCLFYVKDNGQGIEPRFHETVFGLFNKLDARSEGTGVGLALVHRIINVHNGKIWVESEGEGMGSTFCFTLPVSSKAAPPGEVK
ncbi:MAG: hypothetical protein JW987_00195 [Anaerolineaceae bacterium]|nr:hypothetical protein [Anaerolineaceae bacterium]